HLFQSRRQRDAPWQHGARAHRRAAGRTAACDRQRQWRGRLAQQPDPDLRQLLHDTARQRRHRHGAGHRPRHAGRPWRRHPAARFGPWNGVRADDPARRTDGGMTVTRICLWLAVVVSGLALRRYGFGLGLPALVVKYSGSMLWGTMVFFMVASAASRLSRPNIALISGGIAL